MQIVSNVTKHKNPVIISLLLRRCSTVTLLFSILFVCFLFRRSSILVPQICNHKSISVFYIHFPVTSLLISMLCFHTHLYPMIRFHLSVFLCFGYVPSGIHLYPFFRFLIFCLPMFRIHSFVPFFPTRTCIRLFCPLMIWLLIF